jgi:hypothetical protein
MSGYVSAFLTNLRPAHPLRLCSKSISQKLPVTSGKVRSPYFLYSILYISPALLVKIDNDFD